MKKKEIKMIRDWVMGADASVWTAKAVQGLALDAGRRLNTGWTKGSLQGVYGPELRFGTSEGDLLLIQDQEVVSRRETLVLVLIGLIEAGERTRES